MVLCVLGNACAGTKFDHVPCLADSTFAIGSDYFRNDFFWIFVFTTFRAKCAVLLSTLTQYPFGNTTVSVVNTLTFLLARKCCICKKKITLVSTLFRAATAAPESRCEKASVWRGIQLALDLLDWQSLIITGRRGL